MFGIEFSLVTLISVIGYIGFTLWVTEWRLQFRRQMNEADQAAYSKAIDSLLNFETVKYFGNEGHEAQRFDRALNQFQRAAVKSQNHTSLAQYRPDSNHCRRPNGGDVYGRPRHCCGAHERG